MRMTYQIAYSLGLDAADRQMRKAGRTVWIEQDAQLAAATLNQYFPLCAEVPGICPEVCGCAACCPRSKGPVQGLLWA